MLEKVGFAANPHHLEGFLGCSVEFLLIFSEAFALLAIRCIWPPQLMADLQQDSSNGTHELRMYSWLQKKQLLSQYNEYKTQLSWYEVVCGCQFSANSEVSGHNCLASPLPFMCPKRRVDAFVQWRALDVTGGIPRCFSLAPKKLQNPQKLEVNHRSLLLQNLSDNPSSFKSSLSHVITSYELWCDVPLTYIE